jgi:prefoldin subunit 1
MAAMNPLQQQMSELSSQLMETVDTLKFTEASIFSLDQERRRFHLTLSEINNQADDGVLFKPVGRVYLMQTKDEMLLDLNNAIRKNDSELEESQRRRQMLVKRRDEISANIQDLVASVRN